MSELSRTNGTVAVEPAHILVVDDEPDNRHIFQTALTRDGYRVSTAASGEEALAYFELVTPDLVLLDLRLPGLSGQEVIERVKRDPKRPFIPIMLVTANGDQQTKVAALDAGADDFMTKPVDFTELLARVRSMLRLQRSQRSLRVEQRKTELLLHLTRELGTSLDLDQLLIQFLDKLADAVGAVRASIILVSGPEPRLYSSTRYVASVALNEIVRNGIAGWVLRERMPVIIEETRSDSRWIAVTALQKVVRSVASVPIIREDRVLGAITLVHHTPGYFRPSHIELLSAMAAQTAIALDNARLYREVEEERSTLDAVLRSTADPVLLVDNHDRLLLANRAATERLGLRGDANQPLDELALAADVRDALRAHGRAEQAPLEISIADGSTFSISISQVRGSGDEPIGRVIMLQDISAIKELERREQNRLRAVFRRYVSPQVVEEVLAGGEPFGAPVEREIVVLFADLRGYTALTEGLPARVLVEEVLNRYFTAMTEVLHRHGGTIDKFMGDGIIGVFGVPIARDDDLQRSLLAAVEMQRAFRLLNQRWLSDLQRNIGMGIGIGFGSAVVGNIGSVERLDYTIIGDVVNTASRLGAIATPEQIVVSHRLVDALPPAWEPPFALAPIGLIPLKGKHEPHMVYEIIASPSAA